MANESMGQTPEEKETTVDVSEEKTIDNAAAADVPEENGKGQESGSGDAENEDSEISSALDKIISKRSKEPTIEREEIIGEDGKCLEFSTNVGPEDMFSFLMFYNYRSFGGVLGVIISLFSGIWLLTHFNSLDMIAKVILFILFLLYTVINPLMIKSRASKQIRSSEVFGKPMDYTMGSKGFFISQEGRELIRVTWDNVYRVKDTGKCIIIYLNRIHAYIIPKNQVQGKQSDIVSMMTSYTKPGTVKVRG